MKAVKVEYTVKPEYVERNKANVAAVMEEVRSMNNPGLKYATFQLDDGVSFVHWGIFPDEATSKMIGQLASFKKFRSELSEGKATAPRAESLSLVASGYDFF